MNVCGKLNYGHIQESIKEQFKNTQICTNFRKWRKCPKHFHLPTKNCILRYMIARSSRYSPAKYPAVNNTPVVYATFTFNPHPSTPPPKKYDMV